MLLVNQESGEIVVSPYSKFMKETIGEDTGSMIIQNKDFAWSDEKRDFIVVDGDKEDRQALIDSFADECGVYNVLKKYSITGDASYLQRKEGFYGDVSELPVDELNPAALAEKAGASVQKLNAALGTSYTAEELASMTSEQLAEIIASKVSESTKVEEKGKVEENA